MRGLECPGEDGFDCSHAACFVFVCFHAAFAQCVAAVLSPWTNSCTRYTMLQYNSIIVEVLQGLAGSDSIHYATIGLASAKASSRRPTSGHRTPWPTLAPDL